MHFDTWFFTFGRLVLVTTFSFFDTSVTCSIKWIVRRNIRSLCVTFFHLFDRAIFFYIFEELIMRSFKFTRSWRSFFRPFWLFWDFIHFCYLFEILFLIKADLSIGWSFIYIWIRFFSLFRGSLRIIVIIVFLVWELSFQLTFMLLNKFISLNLLFADHLVLLRLLNLYYVKQRLLRLLTMMLF